MDEERKILESVVEWIATSGSSQYGSVFVVCDDDDAKAYSQKLMVQYNENFPESNATCTSAKDYGTELIKGIVDGTRSDKDLNRAFAKKYSNADLLIMTGVDYISGNVMMQKELYVAVDKLFEKHKQVVFFSPVLPKDISHLEDRNRAQFEGSLVINLNRKTAVVSCVPL